MKNTNTNKSISNNFEDVLGQAQSMLDFELNVPKGDKSITNFLVGENAIQMIIKKDENDKPSYEVNLRPRNDNERQFTLTTPEQENLKGLKEFINDYGSINQDVTIKDFVDTYDYEGVFDKSTELFGNYQAKANEEKIPVPDILEDNNNRVYDKGKDSPEHQGEQSIENTISESKMEKVDNKSTSGSYLNTHTIEKVVTGDEANKTIQDEATKDVPKYLLVDADNGVTYKAYGRKIEGDIKNGFHLEYNISSNPKVENWMKVDLYTNPVAFENGLDYDHTHYTKQDLENHYNLPDTVDGVLNLHEIDTTARLNEHTTETFAEALVGGKFEACFDALIQRSDYRNFSFKKLYEYRGEEYDKAITKVRNAASDLTSFEKNSPNKKFAKKYENNLVSFSMDRFIKLFNDVDVPRQMYIADKVDRYLTDIEVQKKKLGPDKVENVFINAEKTKDFFDKANKEYDKIEYDLSESKVERLILENAVKEAETQYDNASYTKNPNGFSVWNMNIDLIDAPIMHALNLLTAIPSLLLNKGEGFKRRAMWIHLHNPVISSNYTANDARKAYNEYVKNREEKLAAEGKNDTFKSFSDIEDKINNNNLSDVEKVSLLNELNKLDKVVDNLASSEAKQYEKLSTKDEKGHFGQGNFKFIGERKQTHKDAVDFYNSLKERIDTTRKDLKDKIDKVELDDKKVEAEANPDERVLENDSQDEVNSEVQSPEQTEQATKKETPNEKAETPKEKLENAKENLTEIKEKLQGLSKDHYKAMSDYVKAKESDNPEDEKTKALEKLDNIKNEYDQAMAEIDKYSDMIDKIDEENLSDEDKNALNDAKAELDNAKHYAHNVETCFEDFDKNGDKYRVEKFYDPDDNSKIIEGLTIEPIKEATVGFGSTEEDMDKAIAEDAKDRLDSGIVSFYDIPEGETRYTTNGVDLEIALENFQKEMPDGYDASDYVRQGEDGKLECQVDWGNGPEWVSGDIITQVRGQENPLYMFTPVDKIVIDSPDWDFKNEQSGEMYKPKMEGIQAVKYNGENANVILDKFGIDHKDEHGGTYVVENTDGELRVYSLERQDDGQPLEVGKVLLEGGSQHELYTNTEKNFMKKEPFAIRNKNTIEFYELMRTKELEAKSEEIENTVDAQTEAYADDVSKDNADNNISQDKVDNISQDKINSLQSEIEAYKNKIAELEGKLNDVETKNANVEALNTKLDNLSNDFKNLASRIDKEPMSIAKVEKNSLEAVDYSHKEPMEYKVGTRNSVFLNAVELKTDGNCMRLVFEKDAAKQVFGNERITLARSDIDITETGHGETLLSNVFESATPENLKAIEFNGNIIDMTSAKNMTKFEKFLNDELKQDNFDKACGELACLMASEFENIDTVENIKDIDDKAETKLKGKEDEKDNDKTESKEKDKENEDDENIDTFEDTVPANEIYNDTDLLSMFEPEVNETFSTGFENNYESDSNYEQMYS